MFDEEVVDRLIYDEYQEGEDNTPKFDIHEDCNIFNNQNFDKSKNNFIDDTPIFDVHQENDIIDQPIFGECHAGDFGDP